MRELKFRAWGNHIKEYLGTSILDIVSILGDLLKQGNWTIEQYTGLKDKNGKEIYEGDIVRYSCNLNCNTPPESRTEIVSWWSGEEEYYPCCTSSGFSLPYSEDGYEVIGNIHENPELLEEE